MRQKYLKIAMIVIATIVFNGLMTGCVEKDVYNPDAGKQPLPDPDEYFGFETRGDVKLLVNYDVPGFTALVEVYDEDPMVEGTSRKSIYVRKLVDYPDVWKWKLKTMLLALI